MSISHACPTDLDVVHRGRTAASRNRTDGGSRRHHQQLLPYGAGALAVEQPAIVLPLGDAAGILDEAGRSVTGGNSNAAGSASTHAGTAVFTRSALTDGRCIFAHGVRSANACMIAGTSRCLAQKRGVVQLRSFGSPCR